MDQLRQDLDSSSPTQLKTVVDGDVGADADDNEHNEPGGLEPGGAATPPKAETTRLFSKVDVEQLAQLNKVYWPSKPQLVVKKCLVDTSVDVPKVLKFPHPKKVTDIGAVKERIVQQTIHFRETGEVNAGEEQCW